MFEAADDRLPGKHPAKARGRGAILHAVERLLAWSLALMLLGSSFAHLGNPYYFLSTVYSYQLTGIAVGEWLALVLPFVQMVVAVCLLARWWPREAYLLAFGMFALFVGAQALVLRQGLKIACGCFGPSEILLVGKVTLAVAGSAAFASLLGWGLTTNREQRTGAIPG